MNSLMNLLYKYNKEKRRSAEDGSKNWLRQWISNKPNDLIPPKIEQHEYQSMTEFPYDVHWTGRWMPDKPGDPTPPPKIFPGNDRKFEYESVTKVSHEMFMGHVLPECDDAKVNVIPIHVCSFCKSIFILIECLYIYFNCDNFSDQLNY